MQPEDGFVLKIVQLEELIHVRHSVFVIGNAGTGNYQNILCIDLVTEIFCPASKINKFISVILENLFLIMYYYRENKDSSLTE